MTARNLVARLRPYLASALGLCLATQVAHAASTRQALARATCRTLEQTARALPGHGPMLLASYPTVDASNPDLRALEHTAFVYDNAAAGIALTACGAPEQSRRIADALIAAMQHDPTYTDGRLRNAYLAGPLKHGRAQLSGYWNAQTNQWVQDAYQVSTSTGNAAWSALLFLTVYDHTHQPRYLEAARAQLRWIRTHAHAASAPAAYQGGLFGFDGKQQPQRWKSTEHNLDVHAAARWAARERPDPALREMAALSGRFVHTMWDAGDHRFFIGTLDDGATISRAPSALDAQVWPLLAFQPVPKHWDRAWHWVEAHHRNGAGYGYKRDPKGVWTEGTAQAADAMLATGHAPPQALWALLLAQRGPDGLLYATPQARIGTDLAIGPNSTHADFFYYHLPHLGATAWAALSAKGWNPFTGRVLDAQGSQR